MCITLIFKQEKGAMIMMREKDQEHLEMDLIRISERGSILGDKEKLRERLANIEQSSS